MPENIAYTVPALVHEATNLLVSLALLIERELREVAGRNRLPRYDPGHVNPIAVDLFHALILNLIGHISGFYRIILVTQSEGKPNVEVALADLERLIQRFQAEASDPERRAHTGYLWNYLVIGLHHMLSRNFGRLLFRGKVPTLEEIENGERVQLIFDQAIETMPPDSALN